MQKQIGQGDLEREVVASNIREGNNDFWLVRRTLLG
jgi:hypothetical protein